MKGIAIGLFLCAIFVCSICTPVNQISLKDVQDFVDKQQRHVRVKRFTCDVLSAEAKGVKLNDAACGVHCLLIGKRGGWCNKHRVCNCR